MKDYKGREVRYLAVQCCGQCPYCHLEPLAEKWYCTRNMCEPYVDPLGEPPEAYCYLLRESDVIEEKKKEEQEPLVETSDDVYGSIGSFRFDN